MRKKYRRNGYRSTNDYCLPAMVRQKPYSKKFIAASHRIAAQLDAYMKENDLSPAQLAAKIGKNRAQVNYYMTGHNNFTLETIILLQDKLGIEILK